MLIKLFYYKDINFFIDCFSFKNLSKKECRRAAYSGQRYSFFLLPRTKKLTLFHFHIARLAYWDSFIWVPVVGVFPVLLATISPAILTYHAESGRGATSEVVPRLFDRGGAPVDIGGKTVMLEDFSFPDQESLWKVPFFNPISSWIEIDSLLKLCNLTKEDMVDAAHGSEHKRKKCNAAVRRVGDRIQTYAVLKQISEDMGNGIVYTYPVIQFEKLYGDLVGLLDPLFLLVPKVFRHTQMKSVDHIYQILIDRALEILEPQINL